MEFPDAETISEVLDPVDFPEFVDVRYEPPAPTVDDIERTAKTELDHLPLDQVPEGGTIAVGLGSRGIHDITKVAEAVVSGLQERGYEPVVVPAMGSHGGATAEGQRRTLAALDLTEERLGCPIDPRMDVVELGESDLGNTVYFSEAALEADGILVVNRVKAHTNFRGTVESGLCKMISIGLGKQAGASTIHEQAIDHGYVPAITSTYDVIRENAPILGGVAIVDNFYDRAAEIHGLTAEEIPEAETELLERAYEYMATLPFSDLDVLVIDEIGKDVSGTGMDTNVVGRFNFPHKPDPDEPDIHRIFVRGLTEETHHNGHGIGLADVTTVDVIDDLDLQQMYANALTSGSLGKDKLPVAMPNDELALTAAVSSIGSYDPENVRIAWIQDTLHLSSFKVSPALAAEGHEHIETGERERLRFEDGDAVFESIED